MKIGHKKSLLSIYDLEQADFLKIIDDAVAISTDPKPWRNMLSGKVIGIYFKKTSTRTRSSFTVAVHKLGGSVTAFGPADLQVNTGESLEDTARVLSRYLDGIVIRTAADPAELRCMDAASQSPIINAMTADEHPTQAISDIAMLKRHFGSIQGIRIIYIGEGNNTAVALAFAASRIKGMEIDFVMPQGYGLPSSVWEKAQHLSTTFGGKLNIHEHGTVELAPADAVYTTRWQTTGTSKADPLWREKFSEFCVTPALMDRVRKKSGTIFMHDLPAVRGEDCMGSVIDGSESIAFQQAEQKLYTAMAVLAWSIPHDG